MILLFYYLFYINKSESEKLRIHSGSNVGSVPFICDCFQSFLRFLVAPAVYDLIFYILNELFIRIRSNEQDFCFNPSRNCGLLSIMRPQNRQSSSSKDIANGMTLLSDVLLSQFNLVTNWYDFVNFFRSQESRYSSFKLSATVRFCLTGLAVA